MPQRDFLPQNWTALAEWFQNFTEKLQILAAKYTISEATLAAVIADNAWLKYWVQAKFNAKQQEKQLTDYVEAVAAGEIGSVQPTAPLWKLPPAPPAAVPNGIRKRTRQIANQIKTNPVYTQADGLLLGIVGTEDIPIPDADLKPEFDAQTLANFALEVHFTKQTADALRIETQQSGGAWQMATILMSSPGVFNVAPTAAGQAEQINLRGIYIKKNNPVGSYSDIKTVVIAP